MQLEDLKPFLPNTLPELTDRYNQTLPPIKRLSTRQLASKVKAIKEITIRRTSRVMDGYTNSLKIYELNPF